MERYVIAARATRYSPADLGGLPDPVARYFAFALTPGQRIVRRARMEQQGELATRPGAWSRFTATQQVSVSPPRFVWDARIRLAPLLTAHVRDSYVDGVGAMHGTLAGFIPLVDRHGTREMAVSSLQRCLAEAPWIPTALLPSADLQWSAVDDGTARATLTHHGLSAWVDFHFGATGEIVGISAKRYRDVRGTPVMTPWVGRFWDYVRVDRMMVPSRGEIAWVLPEGRSPYWRGQITRAHYERAA